MRTIIAGSRTCTERVELIEALKSCGWTPTVVLCGKARGADTLGKQWAQENGIQVWEYPAAWNVYGKSAGYRRNVEMASYAEALIAIWDGKSPGTKHMIDIARAKGLCVYVHMVE